MSPDWLHTLRRRPLISLLKKKNQANGLVGVTLAPDGVAVAAVQRPSGQLPLLTAARFHAVEGVSGLDTALGVLAEDRDLRALPTSSVLAPGSFQLLLIDRPQVEEAELRSAVRWKIKDMIDFPVDDAVIDVFSIPGRGEAGRGDMLYVVAARRDKVRQQIDLLENHKFKLGVIDVPELAQRNIAALLGEDKTGVALLNLANDSSLLTLSRESTLYLSRQIDTGLNVVAPFETHSVSEESLTSEGTDDLDLTLDGIADEQRQAMDGIVLEIQRSLDYYESHFRQAPVNSLVIAPLRRRVPGLVDYFASSLGLQVRELDLSAVLETAVDLPAELQAQCWYAIGAGLRVG